MAQTIIKIPLKTGETVYKTIRPLETTVEEICEPVIYEEKEYKEVNTKYIWTYEATITFLSLIDDHIGDFLKKGKHNRLFWQTIELELAARGLQFPAYICKKKWGNMIRTYRTCHLNIIRNGLTPRNTRFHFYKEMEALLSKANENSKPITFDPLDFSQIEEEIVTNTETVTEIAEIPIETTVQEVELTDIIPNPLNKRPTQRKRKVIYSDSLNLHRSNLINNKFKQSKSKNDTLKEYMNKSLIMKQQRLNLYRRKVELEERKVLALEELVNFYKQKQDT